MFKYFNARIFCDIGNCSYKFYRDMGKLSFQTIFHQIGPVWNMKKLSLNSWANHTNWCCSFSAYFFRAAEEHFCCKNGQRWPNQWQKWNQYKILVLCKVYRVKSPYTVTPYLSHFNSPSSSMGVCVYNTVICKEDLSWCGDCYQIATECEEGSSRESSRWESHLIAFPLLPLRPTS